MEIEVEDKVTRTVTVAPCIKCGDDNANIFDYGYNAPNMAEGQRLATSLQVDVHKQG